MKIVSITYIPCSPNTPWIFSITYVTGFISCGQLSYKTKYITWNIYVSENWNFGAGCGLGASETCRSVLFYWCLHCLVQKVSGDKFWIFKIFPRGDLISNSGSDTSSTTKFYYRNVSYVTKVFFLFRKPLVRHYINLYWKIGTFSKLN